MNILKKIPQNMIDTLWSRIEDLERYKFDNNIMEGTTWYSFIEINISLRALFIIGIYELFIAKKQNS